MIDGGQCAILPVCQQYPAMENMFKMYCIKTKQVGSLIQQVKKNKLKHYTVTTKRDSRKIDEMTKEM